MRASSDANLGPDCECPEGALRPLTARNHGRDGHRLERETSIALDTGLRQITMIQWSARRPLSDRSERRQTRRRGGGLRERLRAAVLRPTPPTRRRTLARAMGAISSRRLPQGSVVKNRVTPSTRSSYSTGNPDALSRTASTDSWSGVTTNPGCALPAGLKLGSTPMCSRPCSSSNQTPPELRSACGLVDLAQAKHHPVELPCSLLAPGGCGELNMVKPDWAPRSGPRPVTCRWSQPS